MSGLSVVPMIIIFNNLSIYTSVQQTLQIFTRFTSMYFANRLSPDLFFNSHKTDHNTSQVFTQSRRAHVNFELLLCKMVPKCLSNRVIKQA